MEEQPHRGGEAARGAPEKFWRQNELVAKQRIRNDAKRPLGKNLGDALSLSAFALQLRDGMRRSQARKRA